MTVNLKHSDISSAHTAPATSVFLCERVCVCVRERVCVSVCDSVYVREQNSNSVCQVSWCIFLSADCISGCHLCSDAQHKCL